MEEPAAAPPLAVPPSPAEIVVAPLHPRLPSFEEMYALNPDFPLPWTGFGPSPVRYHSIQELNEAIRQVVQRTEYPHLEACALANTHALVQGKHVFLKQQDMCEQRGNDRADVLLTWSQGALEQPFQPGFTSWEEIDNCTFLKQWAISAPSILQPIPEALQPPPGPRGGQGDRKPPKTVNFWKFWITSPWCNSTGQRMCLFLRRAVWTQAGVSDAHKVTSGRKIWPTFRPFLSWYRYDSLEVQKAKFGATARQVWRNSRLLQQFMTHVFHVLCDSNPTLCYAFFMILAQIMQHPGQRTERIIQCMGNEGGGKTTSMRLITGKVFGPGTSTFVTRIGDLTSNFNGHKLKHSPLLIYIDEQITERGMQGIFNNYVSADRYTVENKYGAKGEAEGGATIIATSNITLGISQGGGKGRRQLILLMRDHLARLQVRERVAYFRYWDAMMNNDELADALSTFLSIVNLEHWLLEAPSMDLTNRSSAAGVHQILRELGKSEVASERVTYHWAQSLTTLNSCCKATDAPAEPARANRHPSPAPAAPATDSQRTLDFAPAAAAPPAAAAEAAAAAAASNEWEGKWVGLKALYDFAIDHGMPRTVSYQDFRVQTELLMKMPTRLYHQTKQYLLPSIEDGRLAFIANTCIDLNAEEREAGAREKPADLDMGWALQFDPPLPASMVPIDLIFSRECPAGEDAVVAPPPPVHEPALPMEVAMARSAGRPDIIIEPIAPPSPTLPRYQPPPADSDDESRESQMSLYTAMRRAERIDREYEAARRGQPAAAAGDSDVAATPEAEQDERAEQEDRRRHKRQRRAREVGVLTESNMPEDMYGNPSQ